jgi:hypothetical protein
MNSGCASRPVSRGASVGWQHINLTGDYLWDADVSLTPDGFRTLRGAVSQPAEAA